MFRALMICPEGDCAAAYDAVGTLEELQMVACDCGCTLEIDRLAESDENTRPGVAYELVALA
jgi:hypothetical protein